MRPRSCTGKLVGSTRLLVTNQLQYARHADRIVYLAGGVIQESGTYSELLSSGGMFASMMAEAQIEEDDTSDEPGMLPGVLFCAHVQHLTVTHWEVAVLG